MSTRPPLPIDRVWKRNRSLLVLPLNGVRFANAPRAIVLHHSHTSYPLYAGAGHCRSFDEMPSPTSLARWHSLRCRGSVRQRGETPRQLAIGNTRGVPHVHCAAVNNRPRNNGFACFSPRTHYPSGREKRPARSRRKTQQKRAKLQGEIAKAQRHAGHSREASSAFSE